MKSPDSIHQPDSGFILQRGQLRARIAEYCFSEIEDILCFLDTMNNSRPEQREYRYICSKLRLCLRRHDNGSDYFVPLRELTCELDCLTHWSVWH